ncbi:MAG: hypothetical protein AUJ98_04650 [Bacteroidetes bacterium CG2_30_33_31]|nr:MAG: hypothetical protein AUJ98_04650 [Bacteroidetes bacterium CG2_30_33_31]
MMIGLFLFGNSLNAQMYYPAVTTDIIASTNISNVQNTGMDAIVFESDLFQVMCWDGDQPGIGYGIGMAPQQSFNFDGSSIGPVQDPDVVISEYNSKLYAFFIYLISDDVYAEVWEYYMGAWNIYVSSTQLTTSADCSTPNVDIDINNHLAAVWQSSTNIKILTCNITFSNISYYTYQNTNLSFAEPDVAVLYDNANTSTWFKIVYKELINSQLTIRQFDYSNPLTSNTTLYNYSLNSSWQYGKPRIASPIFNNIYYLNQDFSAVISKNDGNKYEIIDITSYGNSIMPIFAINTYPDITTSECIDPVVTYIVEDLLVSFTAIFPNNDYEILRKRMKPDGNPTTWQYYSIVNYNAMGNQIKSSICGNRTVSPYAFYSFVDDYSSEILYKYSYATNQSLRVGKTVNNDVYPNPVENLLTIQIENTSDNSFYSIIYIQGKMILSGKLQSNKNLIDVSKLNTGLYFVKIICNEETITKKLSIL